MTAAKAFIAKIYSGYRDRGPDYSPPDFLGRESGRVFSPRIRALLRRDKRLTPKGDVGALDGDPICDCQDFDIRRVDLTAKRVGFGRAEVVAQFDNLGSHNVVRLDLITVRGAWRIDNIHSSSIPDLAQFLRQHAGGR